MNKTHSSSSLMTISSLEVKKNPFHVREDEHEDDKQLFGSKVLYLYYY